MTHDKDDKGRVYVYLDLTDTHLLTYMTHHRTPYMTRRVTS
jgi:hypothetical protein